MPSITSGLLVASHLSSLVPSSQPIPVPTTQNYIFDAHQNPSSNLPPDHANYASFFYTQLTGTILLRVTHAGRMLELLSLTSEVPPLRFDFPSRILPHPTLWMPSPQELCVIAVTDMGSLHRIIIPLREGKPSWPPQTNRQPYREYVVQGMKGTSEALVGVQGDYCVVIHLPNGTMLRVERESFKSNEDDRWKEYKFFIRHGLNPLSYLLPAVSGGAAEGDYVISLANCAPPTDIGHVWTLSRDRTLRVWTARNGCVFDQALPAIAPARSVTPNMGSTPTTAKPAVLLPPDPQKLIFVWEKHNAAYALVFIPTESASTSGGFFQLYRTDASRGGTELLQVFEAPAESAHCHLQDFVVDVKHSIVYTLWDKQGQSMVQHIQLDDKNNYKIKDAWRIANYPEETELTPAYLDELLLASGSLTDKFFEAVMRPGMFSPLTLQTAIDQYTDACRSLPPPYPPQLLTTYANVGEQIAAVVGCTVHLTRDSLTGAPQYTNYWNALKRDWEGFIARCREVERSARRPLAIGIGSTLEGVLVGERERVSSVAIEDAPLNNYRLLSNAEFQDSRFPMLDLLWTLRNKLTPRTKHTIESRVIDIVRQEIAFPFADIILDQAQRMSFRDEVDEGLEIWIAGRLQGIKDVEDGVRAVLDLAGGTEPEVKDEPDSEERIPVAVPIVTDMMRAFAVSYVTATVHVRYDFCLSLITLLFYVADDLALWNPSLLTEIFAVFRGLAMLRYMARQPAGDILVQSLPADAAAVVGEDDVVSKMRNMQVSARHSGFKPTYSLTHRLIAEWPGLLLKLPTSILKWIEGLGLLQSLSPAHAHKLEVQFCESLRLLGYREVAKEMLAWLPRTPGVTYVQGRLWLEESRFDDAASVMESLAGSFGPDSALSIEDMQALAVVLPGAQLFDTEFDFYLHSASLFRAAAATSHEVVFTQLALSVVPPGVDTSTLWQAVIRGLTDSCLYEDAYASLVATPYDRLKRESISQLVYRMCEEDSVERLVSFNFAGFADEVEDALSFKARNADPRIRPFYSRILYSWYVSRGDYRNAALTMYQRARKIASLIGDQANFINLTDLQLEAYVVSMGALSLIDEKEAYIVIPVAAEAEHEPRKRRKLSKYIPEDRYAPGKRDAEIVELADMQYEYTLLSARLELIRRDPTLLSAGGLHLSPPSIVLRLAQMNRFNMAMATARSLDVDMVDLFGHLATQCLRLSHHLDAVIAEDTSDWLLTDKVSSWPGTPVDRGWRYLRQSLERHDGPDTDYRYTKVVLETILEFDRSSPPPPWLIHSLEVQHPEYLIRTCLRYDHLESALEHTLSLMRRSDAQLTQEQPKTASATWLPYTLIDQVLLAADSQENISPRGELLRKELRTEIANRMKRVQKFSQASR